MIRLLALDLDGTAIDESLTISPAVRAAVRTVLAQGVHVTIVTGRMFRATAPYARELGVHGPIVCYQGGGIYDAESGETFFEELVSNAVAMRTYERAKADGFHLQMYKNDRFYVEDRNEYAAFYARLAGTDAVVVDSLAREFAGCGTMKVNMNADAARIAAYEPIMRAYLGEEAYVTRSLPDFLEVTNPRVNKGRALRFVGDRLGIPMEETMAVGDSYNDVTMLQAAGFGVAMGSGPPELKNAAQAVVGDCRHDGVAEAIERFITAGTRT